MTEAWEKYWKQLEDTDEALQKFLSEAEYTPLIAQKIKPFISEWNNQKRLASELDEYMVPPEPMQISIPYEGDEFAKVWERWKNYLKEQHGQMMRSRSEASALELLEQISKKDSAKAVFMLRFAMAGRYKNFFDVDEKSAKEEAKNAAKGSSFD